jgi:polysaccharide biosynthesis transport protein
MSTTARQDAPRYATLRDYVRVVRRYRVMIVLVTIACAAAAYAVTARQKPSYVASSSVYFQDTTQELNLLGTAVYPSLSDPVRAQIDSELVTSAPVVDLARGQLGPGFSFGGLQGAVSTVVNSQTDVVLIQASSRQPASAQAIANAFAQATKVVARKQARAQFAGVVQSVKAQFAPLLKGNSAASQAERVGYSDRIATLEVLANSADPVEIVQPAALPTTPTGPRTVRNTILGLLLGLTLGLLAAFIRDALDRRLRAPSEIGEQFGWPVLGNVRAAAFGDPVFMRTNGRGPGSEGDREAFRMLRQNIRFLDVDNPPRSVAITSALPEEGKSTVAAALACASAAAGARTLLVECDLRRPSLAGRFNLTKSPGLTDYLVGEATPTEIVQVVDLPLPPQVGQHAKALNGSASNGHDEAEPTPRRLACITAGRLVPETAALLSSARFKKFLEEVSGAYDQVVLDSSPLLSVADTSVLLPEADAVLICVRSGQTTREQAAALKQAVDRVPHRSIGVVVTGVKPSLDYDPGYYTYAYEARA